MDVWSSCLLNVHIYAYSLGSAQPDGEASGHQVMLGVWTHHSSKCLEKEAAAFSVLCGAGVLPPSLVQDLGDRMGRCSVKQSIGYGKAIAIRSGSSHDGLPVQDLLCTSPKKDKDQERNQGHEGRSKEGNWWESGGEVVGVGFDQQCIVYSMKL